MAQGMPRHETILYHLEQQELHRQVTLIVPEGMDATRRVNFIYEDQEMTVAIPEGYDIGQQVTVQVPTRKRPPLERNSTQAFHRGHQHLPDRQLVMENLRHCCRVTTSISLDHPEYKTRYQLYGMLQGKSMTPMLPEMPEGEEPQDGAL
ncbi:1a [Symbiodinium sp. CCMP2592]|nr:1a [Symbiodinium sp. CCMP2592]